MNEDEILTDEEQEDDITEVLEGFLKALEKPLIKFMTEDLECFTHHITMTCSRGHNHGITFVFANIQLENRIAELLEAEFGPADERKLSVVPPRIQ